MARASWDPAQYEQYGGLRLRPALELLARIRLESPREVWDLGCGAGDVARILAERWPDARVTGCDGSEAMIERARSTGESRVRWQVADLNDWTADGPVDLVYSNAALHWIDGHATLFPRLAGALREGGVLAVQMPLSWPEPSHRLMRETLATGAGGRGYGTEALRAQIGRKWVDEPEDYFDRLRPLCRDVDIWQTRYLQILTGPDPVLEWVKGTALRPVLDGLGDSEREAFLAEYGASLREAYPQRKSGETIFPFPRLFIVARR